MHLTAELEENSTLNSKVWDAAGLRGNGKFPLEYFSYNNSALLDVIFQHVQETDFTGITVSVGQQREEDIIDIFMQALSILFLLCRVLSHLMILASGL